VTPSPYYSYKLCADPSCLLLYLLHYTCVFVLQPASTLAACGRDRRGGMAAAWTRAWRQPAGGVANVLSCHGGGRWAFLQTTVLCLAAAYNYRVIRAEWLCLLRRTFRMQARGHLVWNYPPSVSFSVLAPSVLGPYGTINAGDPGFKLCGAVGFLIRAVVLHSPSAVNKPNGILHAPCAWAY